jgi:DNA-binding transcriptional LysR family regulator
VDARQLEYFLAIVEHDGFGRAAAALHVAQPSLSQAMGNLERELGVPLFHRIGRGVTVSDAGRALVEPARQVLRDLETARATMESLKGVERGRVELVSMPSPAIEPLGRLTRAFLDAHPGLLVSVEAAFTPDQVVEQSVREPSNSGWSDRARPCIPRAWTRCPWNVRPWCWWRRATARSRQTSLSRRRS